MSSGIIVRHGEEVRFATDSLVEAEGVELSVPLTDLGRSGVKAAQRSAQRQLPGASSGTTTIGTTPCGEQSRPTPAR